MASLQFCQESAVNKVSMGKGGDNSNRDGCLGILRTKEIFFLQMIPRMSGLDLLILSRSKRSSLSI